MHTKLKHESDVVVSETPMHNCRGKGGLGLTELEGWEEAKGKAFIHLQSGRSEVLSLQVFELVIQKSKPLSLPWPTSSLLKDPPHVLSYFGPPDPGRREKHVFSTCNVLGTLLGTGDASVKAKIRLDPAFPELIVYWEKSIQRL